MSKVSGTAAEEIDLHLIELVPELRSVSPLTASNQITMDAASELGRRQQGVQSDLNSEALANLPPEEMAAKMDAAMNAQQAALDAAEAETDAIFPHARSFGVITVAGSTIGFEGNDTRVIRGEQEEEFANVAGAAVTVTAQCED